MSSGRGAVELNDHLSERTKSWRGAQLAHWDEIWRAISEPSCVLAAERIWAPDSQLELDPQLGGLSALNTVVREQLGVRAAAEAEWQHRFVEAERFAIDLERHLAAKTSELAALADVAASVDLLHAQVAELDLRRAEVEADNTALLDETRQAETGAHAARTLVASLRQELALAQNRVTMVESHLTTARSAAVAAQGEARDLRATIAGIYSTRTMRWTRGSRALYGRLRSLGTRRWS